MAKESKQTDAVITITPEQEAEHERRNKVAAQRDKKQGKPNDSAKPAETPVTEPASVADSAISKATTATKSKRR